MNPSDVMVDGLTSYVTTATSSAFPIDYIGESQCDQVMIQWKWGGIAALAMALLALYPLFHLWVERRGDWAGVYAYVDTDEVAYSAYIQALIDGRPRKNDPYTGRDELEGKPLPESLFSIQFVPAYMASIPARIFGLSSSAVFTLLMPIVAASTALTLFWLLAITTRDSRLAAVGVLVVCCLATAVSAQGLIRALLGSPPLWSYLPFLRRYVPAIPFPFFIGMFGLVWLAITDKDEKYVVRSIAAGLIVALLIFSYFYLWTAALAWLACLGVVWLIGRPTEWQRCLYSVSIIGGISVLALIPYFMLLARRAQSIDQVGVLVTTHAADLSRPSELLSLILLTGLALLSFMGRVSWSDRDVLFSISLLLLPFVVFNQQIITGRALQPFHYEEFVTSYCLLIAIVIIWRILWNTKSLPAWTMSVRTLFWVGVFCLVYGANSASAISRAALNDNLVRDKSNAVAYRLKELGSGNGGLLLPLDLRQAETMPTLVRQPVLWSVHMSVFSGSDPTENRDRFYQYLYYSGTSGKDLAQLLNAKNHVMFVALFGYEREKPTFAKDFKPVTSDEINEQVRLYTDYISAFSRDQAERHMLSYLIVPAFGEFDPSNIDRWYEREKVEQVGDFTIYRLKLR